MKVVFQNQGLMSESYKAFFRKELPEEIELYFSDHRSPDDVADEIADADVFVGYAVSEKLMEQAKQLKHIQIPWTGFNSLDTDLLSKYDTITVSNSHSNSLAIAEHAVSLLLAASKRIVYRDKEMRTGNWGPRYQEENSVWLTRKKVGIIGFGAIGQKTANMLKHGFDMEVLAIKRNPEDNELVDFMGGPDKLSQVLKQSDFVIVAVPLTEETEGMIGDAELSVMKETAVLVNIARGPVIDEEALYNHLKDNKIFAAGIDTWYNYPESADNPVVKQNYPFEELDNIVMSPHSSFKVREREEVFSQDIVENIRRVYESKEPINIVNLDLGY